MKKLFKQLFLLSAITGSLFLASCGSDDPEPVPPRVSITVTGDTDTQSTFDSNETLQFDISYVAEAGISSFIVTPVVDGNVEPQNFFNPATDLGIDLSGPLANEGTFTFNYELNESLAGTTVSLTLEIVDQMEGSASETVTFQVNAAPAISEYTAVLLGGQLNGTTGSFYNSIDNSVYTIGSADNNDDLVDLIFYYVNTDGLRSIIASPDNANVQTTFETDPDDSGPLNAPGWPLVTEHSTRFKPLEASFDFDAAASSSDLENAYPEVGNNQERMVDLQLEQVFAFQTEVSRGSRYGIIEVASIDGTQGSERSITLNVKVQSTDN